MRGVVPPRTIPKEHQTLAPQRPKAQGKGKGGDSEVLTRTRGGQRGKPLMRKQPPQPKARPFVHAAQRLGLEARAAKEGGTFIGGALPDPMHLSLRRKPTARAGGARGKPELMETSAGPHPRRHRGEKQGGSARLPPAAQGAHASTRNVQKGPSRKPHPCQRLAARRHAGAAMLSEMVCRRGRREKGRAEARASGRSQVPPPGRGDVQASARGATQPSSRSKVIRAERGPTTCFQRTLGGSPWNRRSKRDHAART